MVGPRLRVLFVQGAGVRSGAERALMARLRHLPEHGIEPTVAFLADGPFRREAERSGVRTLFLGEGPHVRQLLRLPAAVRGLTGVVRDERIDVVEACGEKMSLLSGWAARRAGVGCVYNLQDAPRRSAPAALVQAGAALGRHDAVVVPSEWMARAFRGFGFRPRVIPNAVVLEELPDRPADVRGLAGFPAGSVVVGLFARTVEWKGAEVLLRAATRVLEDEPGARFVVVGGPLYGLEPGYDRRLRELARELGLGDRVHFTGNRDDALELMLGCDVVCHCPLEREPFGMVVLEAMALGRAVVASRCGGPEEMIDHGRSGMLVDPGDASGLAGRLAALVGDPDERERLGAAARDEAAARFGSEAAGAALDRLYRDVARRHQKSV